MRALCLGLFLLPVPLMAEVFSLPSRATDVVIYQGGAKITHQVEVDLPAGTHHLVFPDLPRTVRLQDLHIDASGFSVIGLRFRNDLAPPRSDGEPEVVVAARDQIKSIETQIRNVEDRAARIELTAQAADARIAFLSALGRNEGLPDEAAKLSEIANLVASQTLSAKQAAFDARLQSREVLKALRDLNKDLDRAKAELAALVPEQLDRAFLVVDVVAVAPVTSAPIALNYYSDAAAWRPRYDFTLTDGAPATVSVARGAEIIQETDENWEDVRLSLSTQELYQTDPSILRPDLRRIEDPAPLMMARGADAALSEAPVIVEESVRGYSIETEGLALRYEFPTPVDVASGTDEALLFLDTVTFEADVFARAIPRWDETAFVMARFKNYSGEPILPGDSRLFFDGGLVGFRTTDQITQGGEVEMGFGPLPGLQINRTVLRRAEGDRGLISKSNEQSEVVRVDISNLTERAWPVELRDSVPYSEQEDLVITYSTTPRPDEAGVDDKRGILQWSLDIAPGARRQITTSYEITWPDGKELR